MNRLGLDDDLDESDEDDLEDDDLDQEHDGDEDSDDEDDEGETWQVRNELARPNLQLSVDFRL